MPELIVSFSLAVANRLADAITYEQPNLIGASGSEQQEAVRQKVIADLKNWVRSTEQFKIINQTIIDPPEIQ